MLFLKDSTQSLTTRNTRQDTLFESLPHHASAAE